MPLRQRLLNFGIALVSIWLAMVGYALLRSATGVLTLHHYEVEAWSEIRANTVYLWAPLLPLTPVVFWFVSRFPFLPDRLAGSLLKHLGIMVGFSLLHGYLCALLYYHIGLIEPDMVSYAAWQHTGHFLFTHNNVFLLDALIYSILVASQNLSSVHRLVRQQELEAAQLQGQLARAQLAALKMQINPHFLFNTLNSIAVLVRKGDAAGADEMLGRLSDFFRQTLMQYERQTVTLRQELALLEQYLAIEQVRFGERLHITWQVAPDCLDVEVPVLILQPLVENAIKHGLARKVGECTLQISARQSAQGIVLQVSDDGAGVDAAAHGAGVGLRNVQERLRALYADRCSFEFSSRPGRGTVVAIALGAP